MTSNESSARPAPPLAGVRVLDFTRVLAGPWATLALADLGAEIIKIENPDGGDDTRAFDRRPEIRDESAYFVFANRNKKSVALDITEPAGQAVVRRLAAEVDVLVENYRPDVMARQGLDHAALSEINPRLVYCSISGYGHDSPLRLVAGYDPIAQAESGMMSVNGTADGPPLRTGVSFADIFTGMFATQAILAALRARDRDGLGQHIDMALLDSSVAVMANLAQRTLINGENPERLGNGHSFLEPFDVVECADGPLYLLTGNPRQWQRLCRDVLARPDLETDPRFATNDARMANRKALWETLAAIFATRTRDHWTEKFRRAGVPAGGVRSVSEALTAPEVLYRGLVQTVDHPVAGTLKVLASPMKLSRTPVVAPAPAPLLGQHTESVLREFGFAEKEIAALRRENVIRSAEDE